MKDKDGKPIVDLPEKTVSLCLRDVAVRMLILVL